MRAAHFATDGHQFQRPRRGDRLGSNGAFKKGRPATLYYDEIRTPAYTDCLNRLYERVLANDLCGVYHAGGPRHYRCTRSRDHQPRRRLRSASSDGLSRKDAGPIPPRAGDVTMNSRALAEALGDDASIHPWPHDPEFVPTDRDWHHRRNGERGSVDLLQRVLYRNPRLR